MTRSSHRWSLSLLLTASTAGFPYAPAVAQTDAGAAFQRELSLQSVSNPRISPDGRAIAYTVQSTDWDANRFDREIWLAVDDREPFQLTFTKDGSSTGQQWSPDGTWLAFLADRGDKTQIYLIRASGGEARKLTQSETGVQGFRWSPDGARLAYTAVDEQSEERKEREKRYGNFAVEDAEFSMSHLWVIDTDDSTSARRVTEGDQFTVGSFSWSPDGTRIAFDHRPDPRIDLFPRSDISVVNVETGRVRPLITLPGMDTSPVWSPDGQDILFLGTLAANPYYGNRELATVPAGGGPVTALTETLDENPSVVAWRPDGVWFLASQRTARRLFRLDPESRRIEAVGTTPATIWSVDFAERDGAVALTGESGTALGEVYRAVVDDWEPVAVTTMTAQVSEWSLGTHEVIQWTSRDGTVIEGVLSTPPGYDPDRRYPLFVVIHGGPTGTSRPRLVTGGVYPITEWLAKGAVILQPNYRGSAGYGEAFRALNVRNLGVGDAWDVLSGVEHLVERGIADPDRLAAMGWSQGGYISAFLTTTSDVFAAISVGAGISNWMTYYVNTDIHAFTRQYLEGTPWDDPDIYAKTSPMTYITQASTPTLIQHGEFDRRVPTPNAYELYQGLQDVGVETKLIIYKGFGHGISKPKERLAALWHNWEWFARFVWQEDVHMPVTPEGQ